LEKKNFISFMLLRYNDGLLNFIAILKLICLKIVFLFNFATNYFTAARKHDKQIWETISAQNFTQKTKFFKIQRSEILFWGVVDKKEK